MRYIVTAAAVVLVLTLDFPLAGQYPGRYPPGNGSPYPGGYPSGGGLPIPRRSKDKKTPDKSKQPQLESLTGILRQVDDASVTIVARDTRTITAKRSAKTKVYQKGEESTAASLTTGTHVRIDATQDEQGFYHAVAIYIESEATPEEKSAAAAAAAPSTQKSDDAEERPVLRRTPGPAGESPDDDKRDSGPDQERSATRVAKATEVPDEMDPDRPRTRRGKPTARKGAAAPTEAPPAIEPEPQAVASIKSKPDYGGPAANAPEGDARIAKAREAVATYTKSLPNYFCQEHIARLVSTTQKADWRPIDVLSATVVFEDGRDQYRDLTVNGKPVNKRMEDMGGSWSTGEFGTVAADLFSPATAAEFTSGGNSRIASHEAVVYSFEVARENSHWHIQAPSQSIQPAYKGRVWLEKDSAAILRIEMQTYHMPKEFPFDKVESAIDYEYVRLGEQRFLLPVHAEMLTCVRGTSNCSRNVIDFRNYRKYSGQSTVTFDK